MCLLLSLQGGLLGELAPHHFELLELKALPVLRFRCIERRL